MEPDHSHLQATIDKFFQRRAVRREHYEIANKPSLLMKDMSAYKNRNFLDVESDCLSPNPRMEPVTYLRRKQRNRRQHMVLTSSSLRDRDHPNEAEDNRVRQKDGRSSSAAAQLTPEPSSSTPRKTSQLPKPPLKKVGKYNPAEGIKRQYFLDFGQQDFSYTTCRICKLMYASGLEEDERVHTSFHQSHVKGIALEAWHKERVVRKLDKSIGRIILVTPQDPPHYIRKVYLVVVASIVVGCLVAEPIKQALVLLSSAKAQVLPLEMQGSWLQHCSSSGGRELKTHGDNAQVSEESRRVKLQSVGEVRCQSFLSEPSVGEEERASSARGLDEDEDPNSSSRAAMQRAAGGRGDHSPESEGPAPSLPRKQILSRQQREEDALRRLFASPPEQPPGCCQRPSSTSTSATGDFQSDGNQKKEALNMRPGTAQQEPTVLMFGGIKFLREVARKTVRSSGHVRQADQEDAVLRCGTDKVEAACGIRALWIHKSVRRKGIATQLLDTLRPHPVLLYS
eukprot:jgi/Mesen1/7198/ME000371S06284